MMKRTIKLVILFLLSGATFAVNQNFLSNTAMSYFTTEDWAIFKKAQNAALNQARDNVRVNWQNPRTGAHGYIIPTKSPAYNGMPCRILGFHNTANQIEGEGAYRFCKSNNQWKIY